jgi:hypothetical protein
MTPREREALEACVASMRDASHSDASVDNHHAALALAEAVLAEPDSTVLCALRAHRYWIKRVNAELNIWKAKSREEEGRMQVIDTLDWIMHGEDPT